MTEEYSIFFDKLRKFINIIDELRDLGVQKIISLPRIAVLGMQSAGKSSLLESIVGMGFLPRGEGLVTRRPLEMRLKHVANPEAKPFAVFDQYQGEKMYDFQKVTQRIVKMTDEVAGRRKGIVNDPITMTIYAHSCPDLTLIDLPGITKVPLKGSTQGQDIEQITKGMCRYYCKEERTIILCVCQGNVDLSTSDGLQMSIKLDPSGERTLGVLTKVDIMNIGTDAVKVLDNEEIPLKYGYVAVKGRSQRDIDSGMTIQEGLENERNWFDVHPIYSKMPNGKECLGTDALVSKLSLIMNKHIRKNIPVIIAEIREKINDCDKRLASLGNPIPKGEQGKMNEVWVMVQQFKDAFEKTIKGKYSKHKKENEPMGAFMIQNFRNLFLDFYLNKKDLSYYLEDKDIVQAYINFEGNAFPGFPTYDGFLSLLHPFIDKLYAPAGELVETIYLNLENTAKKIIEGIFYRFPGLEEIVSGLASQVLIDNRNKAKKMVHNLLDSERGYIFTSDQEYNNNFGGLLPLSSHHSKSKEHKKLFIREVRLRLDGYLQLVIRNLRDLIPKVVGQLLITNSILKMDQQIIQGINKSLDVLKCFEEPEHIRMERKTVSKTASVLRKAMRSLSRQGMIDTDQNDDDDSYTDSDDEYYN